MLKSTRLFSFHSSLQKVASAGVMLAVLTACLGGSEDKKDSSARVSANKLEVITYNNVNATLLATGNLVINGALPASLVQFHLIPSCGDSSIGQGILSALPSTGIKLTVPNTKSSDIYASVAGYPDCALFASYTPSTELPAAPVVSLVSPASPSRVSYTPALFGSVAGVSDYVLIYDDAACSHLVGTGTTLEFSTVGIQTALTPNQESKLYAQSSEPMGRHSLCSFVTSFTHVTTGPSAPTITSIAPVSPSRTSISPTVIGTNPATSTLIKLFGNAACSIELAHGTPELFSTTGFTFTVPGDATTPIYAVAYDAQNGASLCNYLTTYVHDATPPLPPTFVAAAPASPTNMTPVFPLIKGLSASSDASIIKLFSDAGCLAQIGSGTKATFQGAGIYAAVRTNSLNIIYGTSVDGAGNASTCSLLTTYLHNNIPPDPPVFSATIPASPNNSSITPLVKGVTQPGTIKVHLFKDSSCAVSLATATTDVFEGSGILINATANASTPIFAQAEDIEGNLCDCTPLTSYDHSNVPAVAPGFLMTVPASPSNLSTTPVVVGTASNKLTSIELFSNFACTISLASGTRAKFTTAGLQVNLNPNSINSIYAVSSDVYGNKSNCTLLTTYTHDNIPTLDPVFTSIAPLSPTNSVAPPIVKGVVYTDPMKILPTIGVTLYDGSFCLNSLGTGVPADLVSPGIAANINLNSNNEIWARSFDAAGNRSNCTKLADYTQDSEPPGVPIFSLAVPGSPSYTNATTVTGTFGANQDIVDSLSVDFYSDVGCSTRVGGAPWANYNTAGILVTVPKNQTSNVYAQTTDIVGNKSACRAQMTFAHSDRGPINLTAAVNADGSVFVNWTPDSVAVPTPKYTIKRSTISGGPYTILAAPTASSNYTDRITSANTTYYYVVSASNTTGSTLDTAEVSVTVNPAAAGVAYNLTAVGGPQQVSLNWTGYSSDVTFKVLRATNPGGPYTAVKSGTTSRAYLDMNVVNNTPYYYVIVGTNPAGDSLYSNEANSTPQDSGNAPTALTIAPLMTGGPCGNGRGVRLSWSAPSYSDGFIIKRGNSAASVYDMQTTAGDIQTITDCPSSFGGGGGNTNYNFYTVVATLAGARSPDSNVVGISEQAPPFLRVLPGNGTAKLTWSAQNGAPNYNVYRSLTSGGPWTAVATNLGAATYDDSAVSNGTAYYYYVQGFFSNGTVSYPSLEASGVPGTDPSVPTNIVVLQDSSKYPAIFWSGALHANYFAVYRSDTAGGTYDLVGTTPVNGIVNTYIDSSAPAGIWYYKVAAIWGATSTALSAASAAYHHGFTPLLTATSSASNISLAWTAVTGATKYYVYRCSTAGPCATFLQESPAVASPTLVDTAVTVNNSYYYTVFVYFADGALGETSQQVSARLTGGSTIPSGLSVTTVTSYSVDLVWTKVTGAVKYYIYASTTLGGTYSVIATSFTNSITASSGLSYGTKYYFKITSAATLTGAQSAFSAPVFATLYDSPLAPTITAGASSNSVCWTSAIGATSYAIERSNDGNSYSQVASGLSTCPAVDTATNGNLYFYRMVATYGDGSTQTSPASLATTPGRIPTPPNGLTVTANTTGTDLTFSWSTVAGASTYQIYKTTTSGSAYSQGLGSPTSSSTNVNVTGLTPNTTYYFVVTAFAGSIESTLSTEIAVTTAVTPAAPTVTVVNNTDVRVMWSAVSGAVKYDLQRSSDRTNFTTIQTSSANPFTDVAPTQGVAYYYRYLPYKDAARTIPMAVSLMSDPGVIPGIQPLPPQSLIADVRSSTSVALTWSKVLNTQNYLVYRSATGVGGSFAKVQTIPVDTDMMPSNFIDTVAAGSTYYYYVTVANFSGVESNASNTVRVSTAGAAPTLGLTVSGNAINLSWSAVGGATGYVVKRSQTAGGPYGTIVGNQATTTYADRNIQNGQTYYYVVAALTSSSLGIDSAEASAVASVTMNLQVPIELTDQGLLSELTATTFERTRTSIEPSAYDGTITYRFVASAANFDSVPRALALVDSSGTVVSSLIFANDLLAPTRMSATFTAPATATTYRLQLPASTSLGSFRVTSARVLISQVGASMTRLYVPLLSGLNGPVSGDVASPVTFTNSMSYASLQNATPFHRNTANLSQLADTSAWELETLVAQTNGATGSVALYDQNVATWIIPTQAMFGGSTVKMIRSPFNEGVTNFDTTTENHDYTIGLRCETGCANGNVGLYKAGMWIRLTSLSQVDVIQRAGLGFATMNSAAVNETERTKLDLTAYSNPTVSYQVTGFAPALDAMTIDLMDAGTSDSGTASLSQVAGGTLNFFSNTKTQLRTASPLTLTNGNRYLPAITSTSGQFRMLDASFIIHATKP